MPEVSGATAAYKKRLPSGRKTGAVCKTSFREASSLVTGFTSPPVSATLAMTLFLANKIVPVRLQVKNRAPPTSQMTWAEPPEGSIFFSFPAEGNARYLLSGDQKKVGTFSVPDTCWLFSESIGRTHRLRCPSSD